MKKILLMLCLAIFALPDLYGQNCSKIFCIQNPGLDPTGAPAYGTAIGTSVPNWWVLSGTPLFRQGMVTSYGFQLTNGDGMATCYNFIKDYTYRVCIYGYSNNGQTGTIDIQAHDGSSTFDAIGTYNISNQNTPPLPVNNTNITFTASQNFNELRILTNNPNTSVVLDDVGVIEVPTFSVTQSDIDRCGSTVLKAEGHNVPDRMAISWSPTTYLGTPNLPTTTANPCQTTNYFATYTSGCTLYGCNSFTEQITVNVNPSTNAVASPQYISGCGTSTLRATSANPMNVTWRTLAGAHVSNSSVTQVSPCKTTTYIATFTCTNGTGCTYTEGVTVYVQQNTSVTASPATINNCQSSTLTASSPNNMSVTWSTESGLYPPTGSGNVVTARPCKTTKYYATYRCLATGCTYLDSVIVVVNKNGGTNNIIANGICYGPVDLEYNATTPCPGSTYKWFGPKNPSIVLSTQSTLQLASTTINDYGNYMLEVTTPNGCIDTFYEPVIYTCCEVDADFDTVDCNPIRFINKTTDGQGNPILQGQWHWDFGDGNTSTIRNPSNLYTSQLGMHTICLIAVVEGESGTCCSKICKDIEVCDFTCDAKAAFDYKVLNAFLGEVQLYDRSVGVWTPNSWKWWVNTVFPTTPPPPPTAPIYTSQTPTIALGAPGTYNICFEVEYLQPNGSSCFDTWCEDIVIP